MSGKNSGANADINARLGQRISVDELRRSNPGGGSGGTGTRGSSSSSSARHPLPAKPRGIAAPRSEPAINARLGKPVGSSPAAPSAQAQAPRANATASNNGSRQPQFQVHPSQSARSSPTSEPVDLQITFHNDLAEPKRKAAAGAPAKAVAAPPVPAPVPDALRFTVTRDEHELERVMERARAPEAPKTRSQDAPARVDYDLRDRVRDDDRDRERDRDRQRSRDRRDRDYSRDGRAPLDRGAKRSAASPPPRRRGQDSDHYSDGSGRYSQRPPTPPYRGPRAMRSPEYGESRSNVRYRSISRSPTPDYYDDRAPPAKRRRPADDDSDDFDSRHSDLDNSPPARNLRSSRPRSRSPDSRNDRERVLRGRDPGPTRSKGGFVSGSGPYHSDEDDMPAAPSTKKRGAPAAPISVKEKDNGESAAKGTSSPATRGRQQLQQQQQQPQASQGPGRQPQQQQKQQQQSQAKQSAGAGKGQQSNAQAAPASKKRGPEAVVDPEPGPADKRAKKAPAIATDGKPLPKSKKDWGEPAQKSPVDEAPVAQANKKKPALVIDPAVPLPKSKKDWTTAPAVAATTSKDKASTSSTATEKPIVAPAVSGAAKKDKEPTKDVASPAPKPAATAALKPAIVVLEPLVLPASSPLPKPDNGDTVEPAATRRRALDRAAPGQTPKRAGQSTTEAAAEAEKPVEQEHDKDGQRGSDIQVDTEVEAFKLVAPAGGETERAPSQEPTPETAVQVQVQETAPLEAGAPSPPKSPQPSQPQVALHRSPRGGSGLPRIPVVEEEPPLLFHTRHVLPEPDFVGIDAEDTLMSDRDRSMSLAPTPAESSPMSFQQGGRMGLATMPLPPVPMAPIIPVPRPAQPFSQTLAAVQQSPMSAPTPGTLMSASESEDPTLLTESKIRAFLLSQPDERVSNAEFAAFVHPFMTAKPEENPRRFKAMKGSVFTSSLDKKMVILVPTTDDIMLMLMGEGPETGAGAGPSASSTSTSMVAATNQSVPHEVSSRETTRETTPSGTRGRHHGSTNNDARNSHSDGEMNGSMSEARDVEIKVEDRNSPFSTTAQYEEGVDPHMKPEPASDFEN